MEIRLAEQIASILLIYRAFEAFQVQRSFSVLSHGKHRRRGLK